MFAIVVLSGCYKTYSAPPVISSGPITVEITQPPPPAVVAGGTAPLAANVLNDTGNGSVTWSCAPAGSCGTFNPATTAYQIGTVYTAPTPTVSASTITYPITITATSVTSSAASATIPVNIQVATPALLNGQYVLFLPGSSGGWGAVASMGLDGAGNITGGEFDYGGPWGSGSFTIIPTSQNAGTFYTLDATGHGALSINVDCGTGCTDVEYHGFAVTSSSHAVIAEEDEYSGFTIADAGSLDLQSAGPSFSLSQLSGGYSFIASGYSRGVGSNSSWGGIFTADGQGNVKSGTFDYNGSSAGGNDLGYSSVSFTGTYAAPDSYGRGILTVSATPDSPANPTDFAYYIVTPSVVRFVALDNNSNTSPIGSAYGQGTFATGSNDTDTALSGSYIFSYYGYDSTGNNNDAAAGQFTTDGSGNITAGVMDLNVQNASGGTGSGPGTVTTGIPLTQNAAISFSGTPRGTLTTPSGQIYNIYLTDPNLNLLDPNNTTGTGGALMFQANNTSSSASYGSSVGVMIPQTVAVAAPVPPSSYAVEFLQQSNPWGCCNYNGGYTGDITVSANPAGTFAGEGEFQSSGSDSIGSCCAKLDTEPISGTFTADTNNPGHFTGTIETTPVFPLGAIGSAVPGTFDVSYYMANGSQGFFVEIDPVAPTFGVVEAQVSTAATPGDKRPAAGLHKSPSDKVSNTKTQLEISRRSR